MEKEKIENYFSKYMFLVTVFLLFVFGIFYIIKGIIGNGSDLNNHLYSYKIEQDNTYDVSIYPNSQYQQYENIIGPNETYPSIIVKDINLKLNYLYNGSLNIPLEYSYEINGTIYGEYKQLNEEKPSVIWQKDYVLLEKETKEISDSNNIIINLDYPINYSNFDKEVTNYKTSIKIPISAYLLVEFKVNVNGKLDDKEIMDEKITTYKIPLNQQAFSIDENTDKKSSNSYFKNSNLDKINYSKLTVGVIFFVSAFIIFITSFKKIFEIKKKSSYSIKLNKIMKEYGDIIVELASEVKKDGYSIIEVKNFNELVDLEYELRIPITFYEKEEGQYGEFMITNEKNIYLFVLKDE